MASTKQNKGRKDTSQLRTRNGTPQGKYSTSRSERATGGIVKTGNVQKTPAVDGGSQNQPALSAMDTQCRTTAIQQCVLKELRQYFDMLDGEEPANLYRMVVRQAEHAVIDMVMTECRGNQTRAAEWLGISRGNLRTKLANMNQ